MREGIYRLVRKAEKSDKVGRAYNIFISTVAILSIVPMMFKIETPFLHMLERVTVYLLFFDYVLRWMTYDFSYKRNKIAAFFLYPITPLAILDLVSLLPSLDLLSPHFKILRLFRILKIMHYSDSFVYISNVFKREKRTLLSVLMIALGYIFVSALLMFSMEPDSFDNFFEALYWATTALTTVGYGDVYPVSEAGRLISMISSLFGIAVIALPAGIVTGGFIEEINRRKENEKEAEESLEDVHIKSGFRGSKKKAVRYAVIMVIGVLMNILLYDLAVYCNLPVWLDITGTIFAAIVLEPAAGLLVGLINNCSLSVFQYGSSALVYFAVSAAVALASGLVMRKKGHISWKRMPFAMLLVLCASSILAALITIWRSNGIPTGYWENFFYQQALQAGAPSWIATIYGTGAIKLFDVLASIIIVPFIYLILPKSIKYGEAPRTEEVLEQKTELPAEKAEPDKWQELKEDEY